MTRAVYLFPMAIFTAGLWAQDGPPPPMRPNRPPMERAFHLGEGRGGGPPGRWWTDSGLIQKLGLTADQQKRIDALFQQNRLKLIDLSAGLEKEEAILEPLLEGDRPDESQVLAQIDRIAQARAELEKANARMLLGFRGVLTLDQWKRLQPEGPPRRGEHP
ncbi:MAG TPA: Spy/CpxP family protein refolding chaperone [Bryobacteraceae bacterium]|nr:Spy/CpxP family protein refolding chaperone [Bryobacteraceae bacterium]